MYSLIGDPPAPSYFTINSTTGQITTTQSLMLDPSPYYMVNEYLVNLHSSFLNSEEH